MSRRTTRLRVPTFLIGACAALLLFAATASAETLTGESASVLTEGVLPPDGTIVKAGASYDTTAGSINLNITTAAEPQVTAKITTAALFLKVPGECAYSPEVLESALFSSGKIVVLGSSYAEPKVFAAVLNLAELFGGGGGLPVGGGEPSFGGGEAPVLGTRTVAGTTATLSVTSPFLVGGAYNCALVINTEQAELTKKEEEENKEKEEKGEEVLLKTNGSSVVGIPLKAVPAPPAPPAASPAPTPAPAPAALSIAKLKPLKLKAGKSKTVKVKVTNTGATASAQGSLRMKPAKGIVVKPETQKVPPLAPGASWTVSFNVQATKAAKKSSTLSLTGSAPGVGAKSSLVVKLAQ